MKETKQDKIWELAASKVHQEAGKDETNEMEQLRKQTGNEKIIDDPRKIHADLHHTVPLRKTSETRS